MLIRRWPTGGGGVTRVGLWIGTATENMYKLLLESFIYESSAPMSGGTYYMCNADRP